MAYGLTQSLDIEVTDNDVAYTATSISALNMNTTFTFEIWFNAESFPTLGNLMAKWTTTGNNRSWGFRLFNDSGDIKMQVFTDSNGSAGGATVHTSDVVTTDSDTGTWHHYAVSVSGGTSTFYFDGVSSGGSTSLDDPFDSTSVVCVGAERTDGTDGADGYFSLGRVWTTARSSTEINDNMCEVLGSTTGLVTEWTLDNTYNDNSGNSYTLGSTGGSPVFVSDVPSVCAAVPRDVLRAFARV